MRFFYSSFYGAENSLYDTEQLISFYGAVEWAPYLDSFYGAVLVAREEGIYIAVEGIFTHSTEVKYGVSSNTAP